ncbi:MAG: ribosome maturation factor RimP [Candidatus Zixiibacteriota bacterium]
MNDKVKEQVIELIEKPLVEQGCELADVVLARYKSSVTLKVFVYSAGGVDLDECARLSRLVGDIIDETDLFEKGYTLEISSPGLDRPLKTGRDFRYRVGEKVRVHFVDTKRKNITAEIVSATDKSVELKDENSTFEVELDEIEKAKIIY